MSEWLEEEDERLTRLLQEGISPAEIGRVMGRPAHGVRHRMRTLGLRRNRESAWKNIPKQRPFIIFLTKCGCTRVEFVPLGFNAGRGKRVFVKSRQFRFNGRRSAVSRAPIFEEVVD